jgi:hypothetical protein
MSENSQSTPVALAPADGSRILPGRRHFKVRSIGIHGAGKTGKTCYLACCLCGQKSTENEGIIPRGEVPGSLSKVWETLSRGEIEGIGTAVAPPTGVAFSLFADQLRWEVQTKDYAGSLVQLTDTGVPELREEVREWLVASDAIFILVNTDLSDEDPAAQRRIREIEFLLDQLLGPNRNSVTKPLALLLTKWDVHGQISDDPCCEEQKALTYLESHPVFKQIAAKLKLAGERVKVFPISAFGSHRGGNLPPEDGPHPFNLYAPLVWAAQTADESLYASAKEKATFWAGPQRRRKHWYRRYTKAIHCYSDLITKAGIDTGPIHERIKKRLEPLKKARRKRRCWQVPLTIAIVAMLSIGGMWWAEDHGYSKASRTLDDPRLSIQQVDAMCQPYVDGWNPFSDWTRNKQDIRHRWAVRKEEDHKTRLSEEEKAYQALADVRQTRPDDKDAELRVTNFRQFLDPKEGYPDSSHKPEVLSWLHEDETILRVRPKYEALDKIHAELLAAIAKLPPDDYDGVIGLCNGFLGKHVKDEFPKRRAAIEQVQLRRDIAVEQKGKREWSVVLRDVEKKLQPLQRGGLPAPEQYEDAIQVARKYLERAEPPPYEKDAKELLEDLAWRKVKDFSEMYPRNPDKIVPKVREYIGRKDKDISRAYLREATRLRTVKEGEWDRAGFDEVASTARPAYEHEILKRNPASLQKGREAAEMYLKSRHDRFSDPTGFEYKRLESFWKELDGWVKWVKTVETQKSYPYWFEIKSVHIPDGAQTNKLVWVKINVDGNGEVGPDEWLKEGDIPARLKKQYGPYSCRWGSPGEITVHVLGYRYLPYTNDDFSAVVVKDENYIPGKGTGVVHVPASGGKDIAVELRCCENVNDESRHVPPELPKYPVEPEPSVK